MVDQGVLSAGNVLTGMLVGRLLGAADLGVFTLLFSGLFLAVALLDATLCTTLIAQRANATLVGLHDLLGQFLSITTLFALCSGGAAVILLWSDIGGPDVGLGVSAGLVFPAYLIRDFLRRCDLAFSRAVSALVLDVVTILVQGAAIVALWACNWLTLPICLLAIAFGNTVAITIGLARWQGGFAMARLGLWRTVSQVVDKSKWVLVALLLFLLSGQMMPWLVTRQLGVAAAGWYAACFALSNAANPLVTGFINAMMPTASLRLGGAAAGAGTGCLRNETLGLAALAASITAAVAAFAGPLLGALYGVAYADYSGLLVVLALAFLARSLGATPYVGLWAIGRADRNAVINFGSLCVTLLATLALLPVMGVLGAGVALLTGDALAALARWMCFGRQLRVRGHAA